MQPGFWELFGSYITGNTDKILSALGEHVWLSLLPVVLGLLIALPLGYLAQRYRWLYPPMMGTAGILYTIPSLALFVALPTILGTQILDPINIVIALTIYTAALLVRTVADGLNSVSRETVQAATAMGFTAFSRFIKVELPIAVPVIGAGLRVATVSNISLVNVGALIGVGGLGELMTDGFTRDFVQPIIISIILSVLLALVADFLIVAVQRYLTRWNRAGETATVTT